MTTTPLIQWAYPVRDPIAYVGAISLSVLALWLISHKQVSFVEDKHEFLASLESSPPPQIQSLPKVTEPVAKPKLQPMVSLQPVPQPQIKEFVTQQTDAPATVPQQIASTPSVAPAVPPVLNASPVVKPEVKAEPPVNKTPSLNQSQVYEAQLLAYLEQIKRYPSSREARQTRPQGTVKVWLEINRTGQLLDAGVLHSSGSNLLDSEALKTIRGGNYPRMPEDVFVGQHAHRFSASLKYTVD